MSHNLARGYFLEELNTNMQTALLSWSKQVEKELSMAAHLLDTRSQDRIEILILSVKFLREFTTCTSTWNGRVNLLNGLRKI